MSADDFFKLALGSGIVTGIFALIAKEMDWIRFGKKDKAGVGKIHSETAVDFADIISKNISAGVSMADSTREWAMMFLNQLKDANQTIVAKQKEVDGLRVLVVDMKTDFEKRIRDMEKLLQVTQSELNEERNKNIQLRNKFDEYLRSREDGQS